jgi:hypothetical protein
MKYFFYNKSVEFCRNEISQFHLLCILQYNQQLNLSNQYTNISLGVKGRWLGWARLCCAQSDRSPMGDNIRLGRLLAILQGWEMRI